MKVATVHTITQTFAKKLLSKGVTTVIYVKLDSKVDYDFLAKNFELIYAYDDAPQINDFSFNLVSETLAKIKTKIPNVFNYKGYDLTNALEKDIFWGLLENNAVIYQLEKLKNKKENYNVYNRYSRQGLIKWFALIKKLFFGKNRFYTFSLPAIKKDKLEDFVAFRVNQLELPELYGDLFKKIKGKNVLSYQNIVQKNAEEIDEFLSNIFKFNIKSDLNLNSKNELALGLRVRFALLNLESDFLNVTIGCLFKLINDINQYEKLMRFGVRKFFLAAAENEGEGNVICAVANKYNAITYNYMNGAKAKEKINIHTYFTYWFMPNSSTQKLILSYCDVVQKQVPVIGHLLEEKAYRHQYIGTLDALQNRIKNKKIIALFTSTVFIKEQTDVLIFLIDYLNKNPDVFVLIRKHPSDPRAEIIEHVNIATLPYFEGKLFNSSLYDLLYKSSITISFSSTVSLQSTWFNLPTLNFEYSKESVLPYVDNEKVIHVNSIGQLEKLLKNGLMNQKTENVQANRDSASDNIVKFIWPN